MEWKTALSNSKAYNIKLGAPRAFLNYILYDEHMNLIQEGSGAIQVKEKEGWQTLETDRMVIPQNGFIRVFSSNMEASPVSINNTTLAVIPGKLVEEYNYYPYGLVFGASSRSSTIKKTDYLYNGKELQHNEFGAGNGLELTDYGARLYDAQIGRWTQVDPHADRYPDMSGYIPFADSPINIVDLDGRDIIVLRESGAALGTGHGAILVGNDKTGWTYISKDGHEGSFLGTHSSNYPSFWGASSSKYVVRQFKTVAQFRNSPHNFQLVSGAHSTTSGTEASTFNYAVDKKGNKIQRYDKALYIKTMQTDGSSTDKKTIEAASKSAKSDYCFMYADCSDVITEGLNVSENARGEQIQNGESLNYQNDDIFNPDESNYSEWPNSKYNNIEERNKDAIDASAGLIPDN